MTWEPMFDCVLQLHKVRVVFLVHDCVLLLYGLDHDTILFHLLSLAQWSLLTWAHGHGW